MPEATDRVCDACNGTGEIEGQSDPKCGGSGRLPFRGFHDVNNENMKVVIETIDDIEDKVNDVMDKCNDIKEVVDEIKTIVDGL